MHCASLVHCLHRDMYIYSLIIIQFHMNTIYSSKFSSYMQLTVYIFCDISTIYLPLPFVLTIIRWNVHLHILYSD